ncbi:MAG: nucleoside triphosphate pyrophosphohydrolase [Gammaproteobacteria bacterium]
MTDNAPIQRLVDIMAALRDPQNGCPWDLEQDFRSIAAYTIEEAYEVVEAIERSHWDDLKDELGDLLFHIVFYARMAEEQGLWRFPDVVNAVAEKLVRRHPHVFADASVEDAEAQTRAWETHKAAEREARAEQERRAPSVLDGIGALPGLLKAGKLQRRAARVGFDWDSIDPVADKVEEELNEVRAELDRGEAPDGRPVTPDAALEHELGDLLFACVNLCRHADVDPETALRGANRRFEQRFRYLEGVVTSAGGRLEETSAARLEGLWEEAKSVLSGKA